MESTLYVAATVAALFALHLRNRCHPGWQLSDEGRSYLLCGYSVVATLAYWLTSGPAVWWDWGLCGVWALGGVAAFILGFAALNRAVPSAKPLSDASSSDHRFDAAAPPT